MRLAAACAAIIVSGAAHAGCGILETTEAFKDTGAGPADATCATYLADDGTTGTSCHWSFAFRDGSAVTFSDTLWQSLETCRPGDALGADQPVNHPDSYDLREWAATTGTYALSVKDKGALNKTLVFLRFVPG